MRARRRGYTLVEVLLVLLVLTLVLGLAASRLSGARDRAGSRAVAEVLLGVLEQARLQARSSGHPVAVAFPCQDSAAASTACYWLEGSHRPAVGRVLDWSRSDPGVVALAGPVTPGAQRDRLRLERGEGQFDLQAWSAPYPNHALLVFLPGGALVTNGLARQGQDLHLVVAQGLSVETAPPPAGDPGVTQTPPYRRITGLAAPTFIRVSPLGEASLVPEVPGLGLTPGSDPLPAPPLAGAPSLAAPPSAPPELLAVQLFPDPSRVELPGGVEASIPAESHLTMRVSVQVPSGAVQASGAPYFCRWESSEGTFSCAGNVRMTWEASTREWVSWWSWRPPPGSADGQVFPLQLHVQDAFGNAVGDDARCRIDARVSRNDPRLAFISNREGVGRVYSVYANGSGERQLTAPPTGQYDSVCSWSPDGSRLVVVAQRPDCRMYSLAADGSWMQEILRLPGSMGHPEYSSLGRYVAFTHKTPENPDRRDVCVANADGTDVRNLTNSPGEDDYIDTLRPTGYLMGAWAPDESRLLVRTGSRLRAFPLDGGAPVDLTSGFSYARNGCWSSTRLGADYAVVFEGRQGGGGTEIWRVPADGSAPPVALTNLGGCESPRWSPDQSRICFIKGGDVWITASTPGGTPRQLTRTAESESSATWLSDDRISYACRRGGNQDIFEATLEGAEHNLTRHPADEFFFGWTR